MGDLCAVVPVVFLGAPHVERLRGHRALGAALAAITAVVGVVPNLALWFGLHVLFAKLLPVERGGLDFARPVLGSRSRGGWLRRAVGMHVLRLRVGVLPLLGVAAALGVAWRLTAG